MNFLKTGVSKIQLFGKRPYDTNMITSEQVENMKNTDDVKKIYSANINWAHFANQSTQIFRKILHADWNVYCGG